MSSKKPIPPAKPVSGLRERLAHFETELPIRIAQIADLQVARKKASDLVKYHELHNQKLKERCDRAESDLAQVTELLGIASDSTLSAANELQSLIDENGAKDRQIDHLNAVLMESHGKVRELKGALEDVVQENIALESKASRAVDDAEEHERKLSRMTSEHQRATEHVNIFREGLAQRDAELAEAKEQIEAQEEQIKWIPILQCGFWISLAILAVAGVMIWWQFHQQAQ